jgi:hypothetical protein
VGVAHRFCVAFCAEPVLLGNKENKAKRKGRWKCAETFHTAQVLGSGPPMRTGVGLRAGSAIMAMAVTGLVLFQMRSVFYGDELQSWMAQRRLLPSDAMLRTLRDLDIQTPADLLDLGPDELARIEIEGFSSAESRKLRRWRRVLEELRGGIQPGTVERASAPPATSDLPAQYAKLQQELATCVAQSSERGQVPARATAAPSQAASVPAPIELKRSGASGAECTVVQARGQLIRMQSEVMKTSPELCEDDLG